MFHGQDKIGAQNKCSGDADGNVRPVEQTEIRSKGPIFQCGDLTAIIVAADYTAISESTTSKFLYGCLLEIGGRPYFQKAGFAQLIQRQWHGNLCFFCASVPLFACCWAAKIRIIKFDDAVQLMGFILLPHSNADVFEYELSGFIGCSEHYCQLTGWDTLLVLAYKVNTSETTVPVGIWGLWNTIPTGTEI